MSVKGGDNKTSVQTFLPPWIQVFLLRSHRAAPASGWLSGETGGNNKGLCLQTLLGLLEENACKEAMQKKKSGSLSKDPKEKRSFVCKVLLINAHVSRGRPCLPG